MARRTGLSHPDQSRAVFERVSPSEINYWDHRGQRARRTGGAGKKPRTLNSARARQRADELRAGSKRRMDELERGAADLGRPPTIIGAALVIPAAAARTRLQRTPLPSRSIREPALTSDSRSMPSCAGSGRSARSSRVCRPTTPATTSNRQIAESGISASSRSRGRSAASRR